MTDLAGLLADCDAHGIRLLPADEGGLTIDAPQDVLTPDLTDRLKAHKTELLAILRAAGASDGTAMARVARDDKAADGVPWPVALADWALLLASDDLPERFTLRQGVEVVDPAKFLTTLRRDIRHGPSGPRARYGALQRDVTDLHRILIGRDKPADAD